MLPAFNHVRTWIVFVGLHVEKVIGLHKGIFEDLSTNILGMKEAIADICRKEKAGYGFAIKAGLNPKRIS